MISSPIFINRRNGQERRLNHDPCKELFVDMYHRKRRKSVDRREKRRTLEEDYYAFTQTEDPVLNEYWPAQWREQ